MKVAVQYPKVPYSGIKSADFNDLIEALQRGELTLVVKNADLNYSRGETPTTGFVNVSQNIGLFSRDENDNLNQLNHFHFDENRTLDFSGYVYPKWYEDLGVFGFDAPAGQSLKIKGKYVPLDVTPIRTTHERFGLGVVNALDAETIYTELGNETLTIADDVSALAVFSDDSENLQYYNNIAGGTFSYTDSGQNTNLITGATFEMIIDYNSGTFDYTVTIDINGVQIMSQTIAGPFRPFILCNQKSRLQRCIVEVSDA